jgi:hypothetical protein
MTTHIGRNDPCPCGSGRKFKKCHLGKPSASLPRTSPMKTDPKTADLAVRAFAMFDARIAAERARTQLFGHVRPIVQTEAWGKRLVAVGNQIWTMDPRATFGDFLREHLRTTMGSAWWKEECTKPFIARHPVAQWQQHLDEQLQGTVEDNGRVGVVSDGLVSALLNLAYDLYIVKDNIGFHSRAVERLRRGNHFAGMRYELLVAAAFVRAGFDVALEDESDASRSHPEFLATDRETKFTIAVEAKARNRRATDRNPDRAGIDDLVSRAAEQALAEQPYALFVDVAMPPEDRTKPPSWLAEVDDAVRVVVERQGGAPNPFDWVFFTSIPHQWGGRGEPDPPKHFADWVPRTSRVPVDLRHRIAKAIQQYGTIPELETPFE